MQQCWGIKFCSIIAVFLFALLFWSTKNTHVLLGNTVILIFYKKCEVEIISVSRGTDCIKKLNWSWYRYLECFHNNNNNNQYLTFIWCFLSAWTVLSALHIDSFNLTTTLRGRYHCYFHLQMKKQGTDRWSHVSMTTQHVSMELRSRSRQASALDYCPAHHGFCAFLFPERKRTQQSTRQSFYWKNRLLCFPGGPVVKNPPSNTEDMGSIPCWGNWGPTCFGATKPTSHN